MEKGLVHGLAALLVMVVLFTGIILTVAYVLESKACERNAEGLGVGYEYHLLSGGCYVEWNGHLVQWDNIRLTEVEER